MPRRKDRRPLQSETQKFRGKASSVPGVPMPRMDAVGVAPTYYSLLLLTNELVVKVKVGLLDAAKLRNAEWAAQVIPKMFHSSGEIP